MTILPRLPASMRIVSNAEYQELRKTMEVHVPAQEKVHYALTDVLAVLGIFLPPPKPWSDMCTALYLVHTEEYVDTGQLGTWVQCELDACHPADTHEGEDIEWSDNQPGAVMAWPVEP